MGAWDCPSEHAESDGKPQPKYAQCPFMNVETGINNGVLGQNNSSWHPELGRTDPIPLGWFDMNEKGMLLADGWIGQNYPFQWYSYLYSGRHGGSVNVLFFDSHVTNLQAVNFRLQAGNGTWLNASATSSDDSRMWRGDRPSMPLAPPGDDGAAKRRRHLAQYTSTSHSKALICSGGDSRYGTGRP